MLLFLVQMYGGGPPDVCSTNRIVDVRGTTKCTLLFKISSGCTLGKNHQIYTRLGRRPLLLRELMVALSYK
jgi:hypothetical protein